MKPLGTIFGLFIIGAIFSIGWSVIGFLFSHLKIIIFAAVMLLLIVIFHEIGQKKLANTEVVTLQDESKPSLSQQTTGEAECKLIKISALLAFVSLFMNWTHYSYFSKTGTAYGFSALLLFWAYPLLMVWLNKPMNEVWAVRMSLLNIGIAAVFLFTASSYTIMNHEVNAAGIGGVLYFVAALLLFFGVMVSLPAKNKIDQSKASSPVD